MYRDVQRLVTGEAKRYGSLVLVGMLAENLKRRTDAILLYDQAIRIRPKAAIAYSRKADLLLGANQLDAALGVYEAASAPACRCPRSTGRRA